jgi:hypothetical protein
MSDQSKSKSGGKEKMSFVGFRLPANDLADAKQKAGLVPLSSIIRLLVQKWLRGEITITQEDVEKQ